MTELCCTLFLLAQSASCAGSQYSELENAVEGGIDWSILPVYLFGMVIAAVAGYFSIRLVNLLANKGSSGTSPTIVGQSAP